MKISSNREPDPKLPDCIAAPANPHESTLLQGLSEFMLTASKSFRAT